VKLSQQANDQKLTWRLSS